MTNDEWQGRTHVHHSSSVITISANGDPSCRRFNLFYFPSQTDALLSAFMSAMDKLERRLGFIAVPGLLRYVAALTALVFILFKIDARYLTLIDLDINQVLHGQVWRLITYLFIPQLGGFFPDW